MPGHPPVVVLVGPTASGKSTLAAALGARLPGEVINADSVQVYRHFDIGSGKPSPEERASCPHLLFDIRDPLEPLDAAAWAEQANAMVTEVRARGHVPIVCGGTFLWIRALLFGLAAAPKGDEALRKVHRDFVQEHGAAALHGRLALVDPTSAARLHPNDVLRVSRALEVHELSGTPLSDFHAAHGFKRARFEARMFALHWERPAYDERVATRVRGMLARGLVAEVEGLLAAGYASSRAMATVGYRQVAQALAAGDAADPELFTQIVRATRVFARRQRTWLREEPVALVDPTILEDSHALDRLADELRR
jgi:tRNA dimethylallyltransferase